VLVNTSTQWIAPLHSEWVVPPRRISTEGNHAAKTT
jgi:hypothetical protein